jgi:hypothetical protein
MQNQQRGRNDNRRGQRQEDNIEYLAVRPAGILRQCMQPPQQQNRAFLFVKSSAQFAVGAAAEARPRPLVGHWGRRGRADHSVALVAAR